MCAVRTKHTMQCNISHSFKRGNAMAVVGVVAIFTRRWSQLMQNESLDTRTKSDCNDWIRFYFICLLVVACALFSSSNDKLLLCVVIVFVHLNSNLYTVIITSSSFSFSLAPSLFSALFQTNKQTKQLSSFHNPRKKTSLVLCFFLLLLCYVSSILCPFTFIFQFNLQIFFVFVFIW